MEERRISFSVVMTNWNRADMLPSSLESVLNQKQIEYLEILIIDDASTDGSLETAKQYKKKHPDKIRIFETHESVTRNICLPANIGFKRARHKYVVLNPSDTVQVFDTNFHEYHKTLLWNDKRWADPVLRNLTKWDTKHVAHVGGCTLKKKH